MKTSLRTVFVLMFTAVFLHCSDVSSFNNMYDATNIKAVKIKTFNGNVSIIAHDSAYVKIGDDQSLGSCFQDVSLFWGTLTIETVGSLFGQSNCSELKIYVPRKMNVIGSIAAAQVSLENLEGNLDFDIGFGALKGTVSSAQTLIQLGGGKVDLAWSKNLNQGSINIDSGGGDISFTFPQNMIINPNVQSGLGEIISHVASNPSSRFLLSGNLGLSRLQLKYN